MGKYILGGLFVLLLALNVAAYLYFVTEIDGSVVKHTHETGPAQPGADRTQPQR